MAGWFRIFNPSLADWEPEKVMEGLQPLFPGIQGKFRTDDDGWFQLVLSHESLGELPIDRFLSTEKGVRAQLNTWAGWLETKDRHDLMEKIIQVGQIISFELPDDLESDSPEFANYRKLARFCASICHGFFHADGVGFVDEYDRLLIEDEIGVSGDEE